MIHAIYEAATDDEAYASLPQRLAEAGGARSSTFQIVENGAPVYVAASYFSPEMSGFYVANNIRDHDLWNTMVERKALTGRALTSDSLISRADFSRSVFYNEFFRAFGDDTGVSLGTVIKTATGFIGLGLHRAITAPEYDAADIARLDEAIPHLRRMIEIRGRLNLDANRARDLRAALDAHGHGVILTDPSGRVTFANRLADVLLRMGDALRTREGRLAAVETTSHQALLVALDKAGKGIGGGAVWARRSDGSACRVVVSPHRGTGGLLGAMILVDDPAWPPVDYVPVLRGLYGLSAAEAELARLLFEGLSPREAADARGVALSTVQAQLKSIRVRTGVRRQSELATLIASLARLSPGGGIGAVG